MFWTAAHIVTSLLLAALLIQFFWFVVPLLAVRISKARSLSLIRARHNHEPLLVVLAPCFNGEDNLPAFMECMRSQNYPRDRFRVVVVADNCSDGSARKALELGAQVYERRDPGRRGKGYALDEFLRKELQYQVFDRLLLFDIDARVDSGYLRRAAAYNFANPVVLQGSTVSKNPSDSIFTRVGDLIQGVLRLHQYGRSLLGLQPILIGSHGICIDRGALVRLGWSTAPKGPDGDDLELGLRSSLNGIPVLYAPDLQVMNDLPAHGNAIRLQRRRWTRSVLRLAPHYAGAILERAVSGDWKAWDVLIGVLLLPSFSNFFLILTAVASCLGGLSIHYPMIRMEAALAVTLWLLDVLYLLIALRWSGARMRWSDLSGIPFYLAIRASALVESFLFVRSKEWWPTGHPAGKGARRW